MPETSGVPQTGAPSTRSVLLGVFVVFQLAFLFVHNLVGLLQDVRPDMPPDVRAAAEQVAPGWPEKKGPVWNVMEATNKVTTRWSQATWQLQTWALFAPNVGRECVFPALVLSEAVPEDVPLRRGTTAGNYDVADKIVLSDNEPPDLKNFVRWGNFRLRRLENNLVVYLAPWQDEAPAEMIERFGVRIKEHVSEDRAMLSAYLRFRIGQLREPAPRQVILVMRRYHLTGPDGGTDFFEGPFTMPIARWQPQESQGDEPARLEYFNPVTDRFEPLLP